MTEHLGEMAAEGGVKANFGFIACCIYFRHSLISNNWTFPYINLKNVEILECQFHQRVFGHLLERFECILLLELPTYLLLSKLSRTVSKL